MAEFPATNLFMARAGVAILIEDKKCFKTERGGVELEGGAREQVVGKNTMRMNGESVFWFQTGVV